ncbi:type II secretion system F family protein [Celerinatantimonas sp. YJH-8]|uniref:type II secretion system F family protein n=1 Tax=Celerinatantimonas sp. YJH-8 TaxID=3228714 RepID=UPI0038CADAFD
MTEHSYQWQGIDAHGLSCQGIRLSTSVEQLQKQLIEEHISLIQARKQSIWLRHWRRSHLSFSERQQFTEQMATTLHAGIPLEQSLKMLSHQHQSPRIVLLAEQIRMALEQGLSLSLALQQSRQFSPFYYQLIAAAERIGALATIFSQLQHYLNDQSTLRHQLMKALCYPLFILILATVTLFFMFHFIVPKFRQLFNQLHAPLPVLTQHVIWLSTHTQSLLISLMLLILSSYLTAKIIRHYRPQHWRQLQAIWLKLPMIGKIRQLIWWSRTSTILATTSCSGLPLLTGLENVLAICQHHYYRQQLQNVIERVKSGQSFYLACQYSQLFTPQAQQLINLGEESGTLDQMLVKITQLYEQQLTTALQIGFDLIEPIVMAAMGAIIGTIVIAMYLPIFNLGNIVHP